MRQLGHLATFETLQSSDDCNLGSNGELSLLSLLCRGMLLL